MTKQVGVYIMEGPHVGETFCFHPAELTETIGVVSMDAYLRYKVVEIEKEYYGILISSYEELVKTCKSPQKYVLNLLKECFIDYKSVSNG